MELAWGEWRAGCATVTGDADEVRDKSVKSTAACAGGKDTGLAALCSKMETGAGDNGTLVEPMLRIDFSADALSSPTRALATGDEVLLALCFAFALISLSVGKSDVDGEGEDREVTDGDLAEAKRDKSLAEAVCCWEEFPLPTGLGDVREAIFAAVTDVTGSTALIMPSRLALPFELPETTSFLDDDLRMDIRVEALSVTGGRWGEEATLLETLVTAVVGVDAKPCKDGVEIEAESAEARSWLAEELAAFGNGGGTEEVVPTFSATSDEATLFWRLTYLLRREFISGLFFRISLALFKIYTKIMHQLVKCK